MASVATPQSRKALVNQTDLIGAPGLSAFPSLNISI
jgi:hypothetical protein